MGDGSSYLVELLCCLHELMHLELAWFVVSIVL